MEPVRYSPEFKRYLVEQVVETKLPRAVERIGLKYEISRATLYRWLKKYGAMVGGLEKRRILPRTWSTGARIKALLETQNMTIEEKGAFLRRNGLYAEDLKLWQKEILEHVKKDKKANALPGNDELYKKKIRELKRQLKIKDKALKEATALLALKKKVQTILEGQEKEKSKDKSVEKSSKQSKMPKKKDAE